MGYTDGVSAPINYLLGFETAPMGLEFIFPLPTSPSGSAMSPVNTPFDLAGLGPSLVPYMGHLCGISSRHRAWNQDIYIIKDETKWKASWNGNN